ncbi:Ig-like domain-containing protein [Ulvibacter antarcticus]|uniref:Fibronectin type III domain protein n=1 Tax=Ulvibacter antarcticus TaxID=442714 RepID=A0A3L9YUX0_9FLAO|nr:Ig-like domain-containing protein [Ulvibacter antarcticus]RMA64541.1 fibronectin type III domain protein [Ulvibacter antarcticus]
MRHLLVLLLLSILLVQCKKEDDEAILANEAPVAVNDFAVTFESTPVTIDILANDTDPDGAIDGTSVSLTTPPSNGMVTLDAVSGNAIYTPNEDYSGSDTFTYTVCDNGTPVECDSALVTITIELVPNDPPVAVDDTAATLENVAVDINILDNDTHPDGTIDPTSVTIVNNPTDGSVVVDPTTGMVTYTPNTDFVGTDTFMYNVCDNNDPILCDSATVTITVTQNDDTSPPCTTVSNLTIVQNENSVTVSWDPCIDPNGEEVTYRIEFLKFLYDCELNTPYDTLEALVTTTETSYTFNNLEYFYKYVAQVSAQDPSGNSSDISGVGKNLIPIGTYTGDIILKYQYAVDLFENHQLEIVNGNVLVEDKCGFSSTRISDLSHLAGITEINGDLVIDSHGYHLFDDISCFETLTKVTGKLKITGGSNGINNQVHDISPLSNIIGLTDIEIYRTNITSLSGFGNITNLTGDFILKENINLTDLSGFNNLQEINGHFVLEGINSTAYGFINISGFENLERIGGSLYFHFNPQLESIQGFDNLTDVGLLQIILCENLSTITAFSSLETTNQIEIERSKLTNLDFLQSISNINNGLRFSYNTELNNISAINNISYIGASIWITGSDALTSINFNNTLSTGNNFDLVFQNNSNLQSLDGLSNIGTLGNLDIRNNANLETINILQNLTTIKDAIFIDNNDSLTNLDFLSSLELIECDASGTQDLTVIDNFNLADFCGLVDFFTNGGLCSNDYEISDNGYNPSHIQIINGDCSL